MTAEPAVPETDDGNQRWALIDLLLWTAFLLIVIAVVGLVRQWILRI